MLNTSDQLKIDIIIKLDEDKISFSSARKILRKSQRTIERYLKKYRKEGLKFAIHKNFSRSPSNKIDDSLKLKVQNLIKNKYYDFNLTHLSEKLIDEENIIAKRETLRKWAHEINFVKKAKRRKPKVRKRRERMESPGLMLQLDGSPHRWFGDTKSCLIAIIDDANSELYGEFFPSETTIGCMKVIKEYIQKRGIFKILYVDKAGIFGGPKRCNFSQVQKACENIGIEIIFANSPQGKGRIERAFSTIQDRLIPELRINKIKNIQSANNYFKNIFLPNYWNERLTVIPSCSVSEFEQVPAEINLDDIFLIREFRKIRLDHTISFKNNFFLIDPLNKKSIANQKIEVITDLESNVKFKYAGKEIKATEVKIPKKMSLGDMEIESKMKAINLAKSLKSVTKAARISGCSRQTIYKNMRLLKVKGPDALKRTFNSNHYHANRTSDKIEKKIINFSLKNPHFGQLQVALKLKEIYKIDISSGGVRGIWLRHNMHTMGLRLAKKKA